MMNSICKVRLKVLESFFDWNVVNSLLETCLESNILAVQSSLHIQGR